MAEKVNKTKGDASQRGNLFKSKIGPHLSCLDDALSVQDQQLALAGKKVREPEMSSCEKPHAVVVPFPAQGHITPMLKMAKILHSRGFHVTFVNTEYNHRRLVRSRGPDAVAGLPDLRFATIPDGLPPSDADATQDPASICRSTMTTCLPHLGRLLARLNDSSGDGVPPVTCVVADNIMSFGVDAAREIGVPCAVFWTASACGYMGYRSFRTLLDKGIIPVKDEDQLTNGFLDMTVGWARGMSKHMRLKDFPSFIGTTDCDNTIRTFMLHEVKRSEDATAVIVNTLDELEQPALDAMRAIIPAVYTIGPLSSLAEQVVPGGSPLDAISPNLWLEDDACLAWLDGKSPGSVVYVNYGSVTVMSGHDLAEFAWGLANSGRDFLWIVRPDIVNGDAAGALPAGFMDATRGRGLVASWCDQEAVLRHEAVGLFLTHCGWNSTMESLTAGVPMLCWPFFADQQTNCRYACIEWGVGMEVGDHVQRDLLEGTIREAMDGDKGIRMRKSATEWKEIALRATQTSGRALTNLDHLITDVLLARKQRC